MLCPDSSAQAFVIANMHIPSSQTCSTAQLCTSASDFFQVHVPPNSKFCAARVACLKQVLVHCWLKGGRPITVTHYSVKS